MAIKKTAPKKAAKTSIKTAKKAAPLKKAAAKKAVAKKHAPVKKSAPAKKFAPAKKPAPDTKTLTKNVAPKKGKAAAAPKKAAAKKGITTKKAIQPMAKKTEMKDVTVKKTVPAPEPKKNGTATKKAASEPAKKGVKALEEATSVVSNKKEPAKKESPKKEAPKKESPMPEIKIPKTTVKTSVPYQPEYKTLDQRQPSANGKSNVPLVRYNDTDLNEFRDLIFKKLDAAKKELAYLQGLITRKDDMGGDEGDNRYATMEDGSMSNEREQLSQMASRQITYIDHLEKALIRIENKTYGICRVTGKLIDKARLRAVPHATLSLEAKLGLVKPGTE